MDPINLFHFPSFFWKSGLLNDSIDVLRDFQHFLICSLLSFYSAGVGLCTKLSELETDWSQTKCSRRRRLMYFAMSLCITRGQEYVAVPHPTHLVFYILSFIKYCALPCIITYVIPYVGNVYFPEPKVSMATRKPKDLSIRHRTN